MQLIDVQVVKDMSGAVGDIFYGKNREAESIRRAGRGIDTRRTGTAKAAAQRIDADDEVAVAV